MKKNKIVFFGILLLVLSGFVSGCAQTQMEQKVTAAVEPKPLKDNPVELVNQLDREMADARMDSINILSPTWFGKADSSYHEAKVNLEGDKKIAVIKENVFQARVDLHQAKQMANVSRTTLSEAIKAREMARSAGATKLEEYGRIESDFLDLTKAIEKNNLRYAQNNQNKVVNNFHQLEIQAIKQATIGEARKLIAQAEKAGANKIAPHSYQEAIDQLQATDEFITKNPYSEQIYEMAEKTLFLSKRSVVVTEQSSQFDIMRPEDITLWYEKNLNTIVKAAGAQDMRDQTYGTQIANVVGSVTSLKDDRAFMAEKSKELIVELDKNRMENQATVDGLNSRIAALEGKTRQEQIAKEQIEKKRLEAERKLEAERRFNQKYIEVQNYFEKDEAEVYKQENRLVIRLKAINFPIGKSIIMPEDYNLLSKVQKSIRNFNDPHVIIEGHTDSTGTNELNQQLSQERAEAVRKYMIANQTITDTRIEAVGYGPERPLASNMTKEGRAINRRIDMIVIPIDVK